MRRVVEPVRSLRWFRLAILATISVAAVSCSSETHRFDYQSVPFQELVRRRDRLGQPAAASGQRAKRAAAGAGCRNQGRSSTASYQSSPSVAATPGHRNWNWEGGTAITVQPGDTVDSLVHRYGVPASAIAEANNLPNGATLRPGQRLVIPKYETTGSAQQRAGANAPHRPAPAVAAPATTSDHVHVIAPGETLMKLSRQYHKPLATIAKANNIAPHTMVKVGDRIVDPGGARAASARRPRRRRSPRSPSLPKLPPQKVASAPAHDHRQCGRRRPRTIPRPTRASPT